MFYRGQNNLSLVFFESYLSANNYGYERVTEEKHGEDGRSKMVYYYSSVPDLGKFWVFPYPIPMDNSWMRGKLTKTEMYKISSNGIENKVKELQNYYEIPNYIVSESTKNGIYGYNVLGQPIYGYGTPVSSTPNLENNMKELNSRERYIQPFFNFGNFINKDATFVFSYINGGVDNSFESKETNYFESRSSVNIVNYFYNYDKHYQLDRLERINSRGRVLKTKNFYPPDVVSTSSLGHDNLTASEKSAIDALILQNKVAFPVQVETYENDMLINKQRTNYKNFNGLYLPEVVQTSKGTGSLSDRSIYHKYDVKGNPIEISKKDGTRIVYLWGEDYTQPIAKIENATYSEVMTALSRAADDNLSYLQSLSESQIQTEINKARLNLQKAQVTTYTYKPLIGVSTITDPRGEISTFHYDGFNRLEFVKDTQGNIIKEYKYNYKM